MLTILDCVSEWLRSNTYSFPGYEARIHNNNCDFFRRVTGELVLAACLGPKPTVTQVLQAEMVRFWEIDDQDRNLAAAIIIPNDGNGTVRFHRWYRKSKTSIDIIGDTRDGRRVLSEHEEVLNACDPNFFDDLRRQIISVLKDVEREFDGVDTFGEAELR